jgi:hypothetical protein
MTALLADVDRDADAFVAVVFYGFDFTLAHGDRLTEAFAHFRFGSARAALPRVAQHAVRNRNVLENGRRLQPFGVRERALS